MSPPTDTQNTQLDLTAPPEEPDDESSNACSQWRRLRDERYTGLIPDPPEEPGDESSNACSQWRRLRELAVLSTAVKKET